MTARLELVPDSTPERQREVDLARAAVAGDEAAFEKIYLANSARVFALCLRMSGSRVRGAELTQDVFVHVWEQLHKWRGESALSSWIYRLTVNLVLTQMRTERRREKYEEPQDKHTNGDSWNEGGRPLATGSVKPASIHEAIDLERAIAALPPGARTVFVLHDVEGYQHDEIAKLTGTAEGTCRAQLHRARKLLMEALNR